MSCKIERWAGLGVAILGCMLALAWGSPQRGTHVGAVVLAIVACSQGLGAFVHSRYGRRSGLMLCWIAAPVLAIWALIAGPAGLPLLLLVLFTPILGTLLDRSASACALSEPIAVSPVNKTVI